jgi:putative chitinase
MKFDRDIYFDAVRDSLFGGALDQCQVDGQNIILAVWEYQNLTDRRRLAYMLATVHKECATRFWPISEYGSQSYLEGKDYYPYIGRGWVMLTWKENYRHAGEQLNLTDERDLVEHPEMALDSLIATRILFQGMAGGWFTGKRLSDYFNDERDDPVNARQIINGNDCDDEIAGYHKKFLAAIDAAM